jgi:hypothetical protein
MLASLAIADTALNEFQVWILHKGSKILLKTSGQIVEHPYFACFMPKQILYQM